MAGVACAPSSSGLIFSNRTESKNGGSLFHSSGLKTGEAMQIGSTKTKGLAARYSGSCESCLTNGS